MSTTDSKNWSFKWYFLSFINDSIVNSENSLIFIDLSKISLTVVRFKTWSCESLHAKHSLASNDNGDVFPVKLNVFQQCLILLLNFSESIPRMRELVLNFINNRSWLFFSKITMFLSQLSVELLKLLSVKIRYFVTVWSTVLAYRVVFRTMLAQDREVYVTILHIFWFDYCKDYVRWVFPIWQYVSYPFILNIADDGT